MIIFADIAGQYDALMRLIKKLPKKKFLFLGDLIDRGPDSAKVVEFAMGHQAVLGNHEHMMLSYFREIPQVYSDQTWLGNGGTATLDSYEKDLGNQKPPRRHLDWLKSLPFQIETESHFFSHAPRGFHPLNFDLLWNRDLPIVTDKLEINGHNSHWGLKKFPRPNGSIFNICLDDSRRGVLTAYDTDTGEIFQEGFVND